MTDHEKKTAAEELLSKSNDLTNEEMMSRFRVLGFADSYVDKKKRQRIQLSLHSHQFVALRFIFAKMTMPGHEYCGGCLLAAEMGLGKTPIALCVMAVLKQIYKGPHIVICPGGLRFQWATEAYKFFGHTFEILLAKTKDRWYKMNYDGSFPVFNRSVCASIGSLYKCDILLISFDTLTSCWKSSIKDMTYEDSTKVTAQTIGDDGELTESIRLLKETECDRRRSLDPRSKKLARALSWRMLKNGTLKSKPVPLWTPEAAPLLHPILGMEWTLQVVDESHNIRNCETLKFKSCRMLGVRFALTCTGTPIFNVAEDLWAQLALCRCLHIPDCREFVRLCTKMRNSNKQPAAVNTIELMENKNGPLNGLLVTHELVIKPEDIVTGQDDPSELIGVYFFLFDFSQHISEQPKKRRKIVKRKVASDASTTDDDDSRSSGSESASSYSSYTSSSTSSGGEEEEAKPLVLRTDSPRRNPYIDIKDDSGKWKLSDMVITNSDATKQDFEKYCGWTLYSAGVGGVTATDDSGHKYKVYNSQNGGIPPVYCQNLELTPSDELDKALSAAALHIQACYKGGGFYGAGRKNGATMHVFKAMTLMQQISESWRYPTAKAREFLNDVSDLEWNPELRHRKNEAVVDYAKRFVAKDEKFVVFCHFKGGVMDISKALRDAGIRVLSFDSTVPESDRTDILNRARNQDSVRGLVCSHMCDTGLNLQEFNHIMFASNWWNSKSDEQAKGRLARIGQTRPVYMTWFTMGSKGGLYNTIERIMVERCITKQKMGNELQNLARIFSQPPTSPTEVHTYHRAAECAPPVPIAEPSLEPVVNFTVNDNVFDFVNWDDKKTKIRKQPQKRTREYENSLLLPIVVHDSDETEKDDDFHTRFVLQKSKRKLPFMPLPKISITPEDELVHLRGLFG
jgi:hypothetical protein